MRKRKLLAFLMLSGCYTLAIAQQPVLQQKKDLPDQLVKEFNINGNDINIIKIADYAPPAGKDYTIEVSLKVNNASERGLDIETSDKYGKGLRASINENALRWTNPLSLNESLINSGINEQTFRFAVEKNNVHVYKDGYYIATRTKDIVNPIINGEETDPFNVLSSDNLLKGSIPADDWGSGTKPSPQSHGWTIYANGEEKTSWPNSRFENSPRTYALNNYNGNFFFFRWDSDGSKNDYYVYPVTLEANTSYQFSMDLAYWSNYNASNGGNISTKGVEVAISKDPASTQTLSKKIFYCEEAKDLCPDKFGFSTEEAGTYYLTFTGGWGMYAIMNLTLADAAAEERIIIGKNHEGSADIEVYSVTFDNSGAFAPEKSENIQRESVVLNNIKNSFETYLNSDITINGNSELHLTSAYAPLQNSSVNLNSRDAWLYLDNIKPSEVISSYLEKISVENTPAEKNVNVRIAQWGEGTVIIPYGNETMNNAITVFDEENCTGNSLSFAVNAYNNNLGEWDNKIKSFILKKGFSATLANNSDGTGFSRVFIASEEDMIVNTLPEGLVTEEADSRSFVSFVRVFKWEWVGKKGWSGVVYESASWKPSCFYDWNFNGNTSLSDSEYTPMRHNLGWPSFSDINSVNNVSHLLGLNEPDRPDQSDATLDEAIRQWPDMFKSGLRLGSPAPSSVWTWIGDFMKTADSLNYRVDFLVAHIYENSLNAESWASRVKTLSDKGDGRPVWITEWNNGANWTNEWWPDASGAKRDADMNIIYDEAGNETIINRPLSPENAEKQLNFMQEILPAMDNMELLERHFLYNWVEDARAIELDGKLTPAGKYFADYKSKTGFSKSKEYIHHWKIAPPMPYISLSSDYKKINLEWYDHNGETGKNYILEKSTDNGEWSPAKVFEGGNDYSFGETIVYEETISCTSSVRFRIIATSYKDTPSIYSRTVSITRDADPGVPVINATALSTKIIRLDWESASNARAYRIERSLDPEGVFEVIAENIEGNTYTDENLEADTKYYYRIYSLSSAENDPVSEIISVSTLALTIPAQTENIRVASGDNSVTLTWDFAHDTSWKVFRAEGTENAEYKEIAYDITTNRYTDKEVTNSVVYYYKVQPHNKIGDGPESLAVVAAPKEGQSVHISFDENGGDTAYDIWGGYHASLTDGAEWIESGRKGSAVALNKDQRSYISMPEGIVSELEDFTISTWVKFAGGKGRLFDFGNGTGTFMIGAVTSSQLRYKVIVGETGAVFDTRFNCSLPDDEWIHLAITQEDTSVKLYVNGYLMGEAINAQNVCPKDMGITKNNWLGRSQWSSDAYCDHIYDEFTIYSKALSAREIAILSENTNIDTEVIQFKEKTDNLNIYIKDGKMIIDSAREMNINIFNMQGITVRSVTVREGLNTIEGLNKGFYIINKRKIVL